MTYARKTLVPLHDTKYYHVVARCVRRAWLWGYDKYAERDFSHRKDWVLERVALLTSMFAIDVCAYAILSKHYHLVLHVDRARAQGWSQQEVVAQWQKLFVAPALVERWLSGQSSAAESAAADAIVERWRERLFDISWFMRCLNEHVAHRASDWTGRRIAEGKRGAVDGTLPSILRRLNIDVDVWELAMQPRGNVFGRAVGRVARLRTHAQTLGQWWIRGLAWSRRLYGV